MVEHSASDISTISTIDLTPYKYLYVEVSTGGGEVCSTFIPVDLIPTTTKSYYANNYFVIGSTTYQMLVSMKISKTSFQSDVVVPITYASANFTISVYGVK